MSARTDRLIPKLNDREVISAFQKVAAKFQDTTLSFSDGFGQIPVESLDLIKKQAGFNLHGANIRLGRSTNFSWSRDQSSAIADKRTISWESQNPPNRDIVVQVSSALDRALSQPMADLSNDNAESPTPHSTQREILLALEGTAAKLIDETVSYRRQLDESYASKEEKLSERIDQLRTDELNRLAEEKERQETELTARSQSLNQRNEELNERQKQLDDRNNTHVRREIRASLLQLTKDRLANFSVSKETRTQYLAVHAVSIVGIIALGAGAMYFGAQIVPDARTGAFSSGVVALAIKSGALLAASIALGSWYLGWLNRWLQRIADAEFKLQQFRLDIERASWLAETVLEWKSSDVKEPFPELLATRLSTGLFSSSTSEFDDPKTPATHLAEALFGGASSVKLKLADHEVGFDRKALRNLDEPR